MYKRLLVPVDGSDLSDRAMHESVVLAQQLGAAITGFIAEPMQPALSETRPHSLWVEDVKEHEARTEAHARQVLGRFEDVARAAGVPFTGVYDHVPRIDKAIITVAEAQGCDMIVMVTHGRGAFGEFLFGSHTKAVLAGSKLPLLVLH